MENNRTELISLYREYEQCCREKADLDELASVLESLSYELSVSGCEKEAWNVFRDIFELRKSLAKHDFNKYGKPFAQLLTRKASSWTDNIDEAIACQEEAIDIFKRLWLYDEKGFDIGIEDAFGFLGQLYCFKGDYESGIRYTTTALERELESADNDFQIGIYYRRLGIAHLCLGNKDAARNHLQKAIEYFTNANQTDLDPIVYPEVTGSCCQLLKECNGRTHTDEYYKQWLVG